MKLKSKFRKYKSYIYQNNLNNSYNFTFFLLRKK